MAFDLNFWFSLICSLGGVSFFVISLLIITKIKALFPGANLIKKWVIIQALIILFLFGYVFNILFMTLYALGDEGVVWVLNLMTAIVYVFGGLFVLIVINLSYKTYKTILLEPKND